MNHMCKFNRKLEIMKLQKQNRVEVVKKSTKSNGRELLNFKVDIVDLKIVSSVNLKLSLQQKRKTLKPQTQIKKKWTIPTIMKNTSYCEEKPDDK